MKFKSKFFISLLIIFVLSIVAVPASDVNSTDFSQLNDTVLDSSFNDNLSTVETSNNSKTVNNTNNGDMVQIIKTNPKITVKSTYLKSKDKLEFNFKNASGNPLKSKS
ncbi:MULTISPECIES: hypothetical protein [Methanobrevibacter]|nr:MULTISPECIES: hypothetical protein [Methanobrevibacter]OEC99266.1 hypothetical protein A9505_03735 [Methanobrevibacter sp. A27]